MIKRERHYYNKAKALLYSLKKYLKGIKFSTNDATASANLTNSL